MQTLRSLRAGRLGTGLFLLLVGCGGPLSLWAGTPAETIRAMLERQHEHGQFNGSILVARDGNVVYRDAFGSGEDPSTPNKPDTPSNLASVSKQFTAMAVMMLKEHGKLSYDDPAANYLPALQEAAPGITVRQLLTHTSGVPDVGDLGIDQPHLEESEVLKTLKVRHASFAAPGQQYRYSNTGYMLLAMIVERISGGSLGDYLDQHVFKPLHMDHTHLAARRGEAQGEGGIISTVDDLLEWDQALYTEKLVKQTTLREAFTPARVENGVSTYGFGWNITQDDGQTLVWHNGRTGPYRAFVGRWLTERLFVAVLTNKGDSRRPEISAAIVDILHGRPFAEPKLSIVPLLANVIGRRGIEAGLNEYLRLKAAEPAKFDYSESELNSLGYLLLSRGAKDAAIGIFQQNTKEHPESSNAYDSLGEAYASAGQKAQADRAYRRAIELDPNNLNSQRMLQSLEQ